MEQLQEGYVASVAATAGCLMEPIPRDFYGADVRLVRSYPPPREETVVQLQLKSTTQTKPDPTRETFSYTFKKSEYLARLAEPRKHIKNILVVMAIHSQQALWTEGDHDHLRLQHCCYWVSLEGLSVPAGVASPSVRIPLVNIFNASALTSIMDRLERGEALRV